MSELIAFCYLHEDGDERNRLLLFHQELQLISSGKTHRFPLQEISSIHIQRKKLWLPIVAGGIMTSFGLVSVFRSMYNPWLMLSLTIAGAFLMYWGFEGSPVLNIQRGRDNTFFFLKSATPNVKAFLSFLHRYRLGDSYQVLYIPKHQDFEGTFITAMTEEQMRASKTSRSDCFTIDPVQFQGEIKFEWDEEARELIPRIYGSNRAEIENASQLN